MGPGISIAIVFLCGVANFAAHRAVLDSGHPLVLRMHQASAWMRPPVTLGCEFVALLVALLVVAQGNSGWAWIYGLYTAGCLWTAWAVRTGRM